MYKHFFKRFFDIIVSLIALPFVLIAIAIMAPFIYFEDRGPIFYNAYRRGKNGKNFKMYKLRSMYVNSADIKNADGSTFNSAKDPRVTKIGRIMRKTSIDELPQILNVLKGDMSFVGPRPSLPNVPYDELPELSKKRLNVRPGITGYVQAYYRNSIGQDEKIRLACYYVDNVSFKMDAKIILHTIGSVLRRKNIYASTQEKPAEVSAAEAKVEETKDTAQIK